MTERANFDHFLIQKACEKGAKLIEECCVLNFQRNQNELEVNTTKGNFKASFVIGADGANGIVARKLFSSESPKPCPAIECEVYVSKEKYVQHSRLTRFDMDASHGGYGWIFPKNDHLSIGICTLNKSKKSKLKAELEKYMEDLDLGTPERIEQAAYVIPVKRRQQLVSDRTFLVGDAAGLADPLTAEGIANAVISGKLAAQALLKSRLDPGLAKETYLKEMEDQILAELKVANVVARLFYRHFHLRKLFLSKVGNSFAESLSKVASGEETYQQIVNSSLGRRLLYKIADKVL